MAVPSQGQVGNGAFGKLPHPGLTRLNLVEDRQTRPSGQMQEQGNGGDAPDNEDQQKFQRHCPLPDHASRPLAWRCDGPAVKGGVGERATQKGTKRQVNLHQMTQFDARSGTSIWRTA